MKTKNVSYRSYYLLKRLHQVDKQFFTISDAAEILTGAKPSAVRELLRAMTERGLIMRIKDGLYHVVPFEYEIESYYPNWHLAASAMAENKEHYIGFYSAFEIHGLTTQPALKEQVAVKQRMQPKFIYSKGIKFEFITFNEKHFFGYKQSWIDDFNKVYCSDIEKTIIDSLYKPSSANGIDEIVKAIYRAKNKLNSDSLMEYLEKFYVQAVWKRLGFLLDNMDILPAIRSVIQTGISNSYAVLDPFLPKTGKHNSKWKVLDNVEIQESMKGIET